MWQFLFARVDQETGHFVINIIVMTIKIWHLKYGKCVGTTTFSRGD